MKDRTTLIMSVIAAILSVVVLIIVIVVANSSYKVKSGEISTQTTDIQKKIDEIKSAKDNNNFTPEELVKAFLTEVKADAVAKEKLYLSSKVQDMDIKNTLKLGNDLANMTIGDSEQTIVEDTAEVAINLEVASEQVARTFSLVKEDGAWKINGVIAE